MDAILFSANPKLVKMSDVIAHLKNHEHIYFEVKFPIRKARYIFPMTGFIHISGNQVRYVATIEDILPFSRDHYENSKLAQAVKPVRWLEEWRDNINNIRFDNWRYALVISHIDFFEYDTYALIKYDGEPVTLPPQKYIRVLPPAEWHNNRVERGWG